MTTITLFHSGLGLRLGFLDGAEMLRSHGHTVHVVEQYDGRVFDDYDTAMEFARWIDFPALMELARKATAELPDGFVAMEFSNARPISCAPGRPPGPKAIYPRADPMARRWAVPDAPLGSPREATPPLLRSSASQAPARLEDPLRRWWRGFRGRAALGGERVRSPARFCRWLPL
jgi:hypothetical protein